MDNNENSAGGNVNDSRKEAITSPSGGTGNQQLPPVMQTSKNSNSHKIMEIQVDGKVNEEALRQPSKF